MHEGYLLILRRYGELADDADAILAGSFARDSFVVGNMAMDADYECFEIVKVAKDEPTAPPRDLWAEWRRLLAEGVQVTSELEHDNHTTFILCVVGFDADDQAEYRGSHADPEQAFRLALAKMEEQGK